MATYIVKIGNIDPSRPGHRRDCSQVAIRFAVTAKDKAEALKKLEEQVAQLNASWPAGLIMLGTNLNTRDVEEA